MARRLRLVWWMSALPALQLGVSFYASVAFILFAVFFVSSMQDGLPRRYAGLMLVAACLFLTKSVLNLQAGAELREILLPVREYACFLGLCLMVGSVARDEPADERHMARWLMVLLIALLAFILLQKYFFSRGAYFGLPLDFYVRNRATLETAEDALYHQSRYRPTAFYGEPSYAAFVVFSLMVVGLECLRRRSRQVLVFVLSYVSLVLLESASGIIAATAYAAVHLLVSGGRAAWGGRLLWLACFCALVVLLLASNEAIGSRFAAMAAGQDASSAGRLGDPVDLLRHLAERGRFFGATEAEIQDFLGVPSLDNALLRLLAFYGVLVLLPLYVISSLAGWSRMVLYFFLVMGFNGDIFSYDKVVVVAMVIALYVQSVRWDKKK